MAHILYGIAVVLALVSFVGAWSAILVYASHEARR